MKKFAVLSLSGGLDSASLLLHLLSKEYIVTCIVFDYGQKHFVEMEKAKQLVSYIQSNGYRESVTLETVSLFGLGKLLHSSLVTGGKEVPEGDYHTSNMESTVVPNRNKIFSSIIQSVAISISKKNPGCEVAISMGIHSGDHDTYPDTTEAFRNKDFEAFLEGNWNTEFIELQTPFLEFDKGDVLCAGIDACGVLGLDKDEIYRRTMTSYKPIVIDGVWYSDCLSASSRERVKAFVSCGLEDPLSYAHNGEAVSWDEVLEIVKQDSNA